MKRHALQILTAPPGSTLISTKVNFVLHPKYICEIIKRYNPDRHKPFWFFQLIFLFLSLLNLTNKIKDFLEVLLMCNLDMTDLLVI